jgi:hypothetical protein
LTTYATERAGRVSEFFRQYRIRFGEAQGIDRNQSVTEFMCDLAHLADSFGCDGEARLNDAVTLYEETKQVSFLVEVRDHHSNTVITFKVSGYDDEYVAGESALEWFRGELSYDSSAYEGESYDEEYEA